MSRRIWLLGLGLLPHVVLLLSCSGDDGGSNGTSAAGGTAGEAGGGAGGAAGGWGGTGGGGGVILTDGGPGTGGGGSAEVCDGIDNDGNGIADDVDVGGDGVCDCLNIATIGQIGPWSNGGNIFAQWLNARSSTPAVALGDQRLTDDLLAPFQVIVVLYASTMQLKTLPPHHAFSQAEVEAFHRWVLDGGGVMTTIGYTPDEASEVENVNRLLHPLGLGYSTTQLDLSGFITNWVQHPVTDSVSNIFTENGVEPADVGGTTLAQDSAGRIALKVAQAGKGKAVVWGDEWITYDSEWQDVHDQQVERFWLNTLKWLTFEKECQVTLPPVK